MSNTDKKSLFITLEGGEGSGKSTLIKRLVARLTALGNIVITTREPGGTSGAEEIRNLLVKGSAERWDVTSEICLFYAAREDHLYRLIRPALEDGKIVICDRFFDSTRAYQGQLGARESNIIKALEENIVGPTMPDITLILDIDVETGLTRANSRNNNDGDDKEGRFEAKKIEFHQKLRDAYLEIARKEPERCKVIDATKTPDEIEEIAMGLITQILDTSLKEA